VLQGEQGTLNILCEYFMGNISKMKVPANKKDVFCKNFTTFQSLCNIWFYVELQYMRLVNFIYMKLNLSFNIKKKESVVFEL
jgi:hypothetical protein